MLGVTGLNGVGKTLIAVGIAIEFMLDGGVVYSTVQIDYTHPKTRKVYSSKPITSLGQLLNIRGCLVLLDEVATTFPSDNSQSLPQALHLFLQVMRHRHITVIWTGPTWKRAHIKLREATHAQLNVATLIKSLDRDNPWPRPVVIMAGLMDSAGVPVDADPTRVLRRRLYLPKTLASWGAYDTHADTPLIGFNGLTGTCPDCGGSMLRPKHDRARHDALGIPFYDEAHQPAPVFEDVEPQLEVAGGVSVLPDRRARATASGIMRKILASRKAPLTPSDRAETVTPDDTAAAGDQTANPDA